MDAQTPNTAIKHDDNGEGAPLPSPKRSSYILSLSLPIVSFVALLFGAIWYASESRNEAIRDAQVQAATYRDAFAAHTNRTFDVTRLVLHQISSELSREAWGTWYMQVGRDQLTGMMNGQLETLPQLTALMVVDVQGHLLVCAGPNADKAQGAMPEMDLLTDAQPKGAALKIGAPVRGHPCLGEDVVVPVYTEYKDVLGQNVGYIIGAVDPAYFSKFFDALTQGAKSTMGLIHIGGALLAREPFKPQVIGVSAVKSKIYQAYHAGNEIDVKIATSPVDGTQRIGAFMKLDGIPVLAYVATAVDDALIPWRESLKQRVPIAMAVLTLVMVMGGMSLFATVQRENLASALTKRTQALVKAKDAAEQADRSKSEFLSIVSHELRTPLTSIKGSLGLLSGHMLKDLPEQPRKMLDMAVENTDRLALLVDDILDMEKLMSGKVDLQLEDISLSAFVAKTIEQNQGYAREYDVEFVFLPPSHDIKVRVDVFKLGQVLTNLLSNAAKFSNTGDKVEITIAEHGGQARVEVQDHGRGIPADFHDRIFEKFAQVETLDHRSTMGTGLGLSISKAIIDYHGGKIGFVSRPGEGAMFYFELERI